MDQKSTNSWTFLHLYLLLAWEPSTDKVTKSYSHRLPALKILSGNWIVTILVDTHSLISQNQAKNIPVCLSSSPIKRTSLVS